MKKILTIALLACLLMPTAALAAAKSPTQTVKDGMDKLVSIVHDPMFDVQEGEIPKEQVELLSRTVAEFFDYEELTKRAVGRAWLSFTETQRTELTAAFRGLLEKTYLRKLETKFLDELKSFSADSIVYNDEKIKEDKSMVFATFNLTDKTLDVNFRLIDQGGTWMVYDIIGEGVTLLGVYKDDFRAALTKMTPEEFVEELKQKTQKVASGELDEETVLDNAEKASDKPAETEGE